MLVALVACNGNKWAIWKNIFICIFLDSFWPKEKGIDIIYFLVFSILVPKRKRCFLDFVGKQKIYARRQLVRSSLVRHHLHARISIICWRVHFARLCPPAQRTSNIVGNLRAANHRRRAQFQPRVLPRTSPATSSRASPQQSHEHRRDFFSVHRHVRSLIIGCSGFLFFRGNSAQYSHSAAAKNSDTEITGRCWAYFLFC